MDYDAAISRLIELGLTDKDVRLLSKVGSQPLTLADVDRLAVLAQQSEMQPSALAFEAQQIAPALLGPESAAPAAPEQRTGNLQQMTQNELAKEIFR